MAAWTDPPTFVALDKLRAADLNTYLRDNPQFLKDQLDLLLTTNPRARVSMAGSTTIPNGTPTTVPLNTTSWNVGMTLSGGKLIANRPGIYGGLIYVTWETDSRGFRRIGVAANGSTVVTSEKTDAEGTDPQDQCIPWEIFLDENDYVELHAYYADATLALTTLDVTGAAMTAAWKGLPT